MDAGLQSAALHLLRTASVIGREHVRLGRNNQDGCFAGAGGGLAVAVVTDGCSSQPRSEVGARLGARFLGARLLACGDAALDAALARRTTDALVEWIGQTAAGLDSGAVAEVVAEHFLFTFLCAVARGDQALVFGVGDGVVLVDEAVTCLDAGPENAPAYAAYRLFGGACEPVIHHAGAARVVAVATDGLEGHAGRLRELVAGLSGNPLQLQRRLNVFSEEQRLHDDATVATITPSPCESGERAGVRGGSTDSVVDPQIAPHPDPLPAAQGEGKTWRV